MISLRFSTTSLPFCWVLKKDPFVSSQLIDTESLIYSCFLHGLWHLACILFIYLNEHVCLGWLALNIIINVLFGYNNISIWWNRDRLIHMCQCRSPPALATYLLIRVAVTYDIYWHLHKRSYLLCLDISLGFIFFTL